MSKFQKTIKEEIKIAGFGLHTGCKVNMAFIPAGAGTGINFVRVDLPGRPIIRACIDNLIEPGKETRRTSIGINGACVHTVEHLMAVLSGMEIDNLTIEIDAEEVPGLDGSGQEFVETIKKAGVQEFQKERKYFALKEPVYIDEDHASIIAYPQADYNICYTLNYNHPAVKSQYMEAAINEENFTDSIAPSRTFCLEEEAQALLAKGLGKGANYNNTLVMGKNDVVRNKLRFEDEFVRHKILDLIGDIGVLGFPLKARVVAIKSGHALNIKLIKKIYQQKEKYQLGGIKAGYFPQDNEQLDASVIMKILPHRYPFLLVDRIISLEKGKKAVGIKNVTANEHFFVGHFPGKPIMPGVLIVEAMAQVGGVMMLSSEENRGRLAYFLAANEVKFRKTVVPGDSLMIEVEVGRIKARTGQVRAKAYVDGKVCAEAELMFALAET